MRMPGFRRIPNAVIERSASVCAGIELYAVAVTSSSRARLGGGG